jgi:prepilin-type N-terminal cleavage/methylation domain-containing protein/prepilin-type processing-associated H-X9-DG protein
MKAGRGGFTLAEVLVVIAVLAMLAGLLSPVLVRTRERAEQASCLSNLRQLGTAHVLYLQDYDEQLTDWWQPAAWRPEPYRNRRYWTEFLQPYLRSERILHDPGHLDSEVPPPGARLAEYALGTWGPEGSGWPNDPYWRWPGAPLSLAEVRRPGETVCLTDGYTTTERTRALVAGHRGGANVSFLDGHAKWMWWSDLYEIKHDHEGPYQHEQWYFYRYITANR